MVKKRSIAAIAVILLLVIAGLLAWYVDHGIEKVSGLAGKRIGFRSQFG
jgi:hypothetical protein